MKLIRATVTLLLALAWVLMTSHCRIEAMPGFEFLRCAADVHESGEGGDPCKDGDCCSVESAQYHAPRQQEKAPVIIFALVPAIAADLVEQALPNEVCPGILTAAPPGLTSSWQFSFRTALPPRAPSIAS